MDISEHRFMVMSCTLPVLMADKISKMNTEEKKKILAPLWDKTMPDEGRNGAGPLTKRKLKVLYKVAGDQMPSERGLDGTQAHLDSSQSISMRVEDMRSNLSKLSEAVKASEVPDNFDDCIKLFKQLRQKYEALEDYTMSQMGQLDAVRKEVDGLKQDVAKERREAASVTGKNKGEQKTKDRMSMDGGTGMASRLLDMRLPLLIVGLGVLVGYLAGRLVPPLGFLHNN